MKELVTITECADTLKIAPIRIWALLQNRIIEPVFEAHIEKVDMSEVVAYYNARPDLLQQQQKAYGKMQTNYIR